MFRLETLHTDAQIMQGDRRIGARRRYKESEGVLTAGYGLYRKPRRIFIVLAFNGSDARRLHHTRARIYVHAFAYKRTCSRVHARHQQQVKMVRDAKKTVPETDPP